MSYNRYSKFTLNGKIQIVPSITIYEKSTDYVEVYHHSQNRLDNLSYKYYGDANYDWLIMMANPEYGSMEFDIPDGAIIRIPYPLSTTLELYEKAVDRYNALYKS